MRVLIIGAGTGGLALAHRLKQAGVAVSVFERDPVPNADTGGYRVGISPAGSRALKACVPPDLYELYVVTSARAPRYFNMVDERFAKLLCFDLSSISENIAAGEKNVIRRTLRRVLLRGLEAEVAFGKRFAAYTPNPDGTVTARFEDGSEAVGDVLVGADGSGSPVRKQLLPHARLENTGMASFGGKIPATAETRALLSPEMLAGMTMIMAPRGFGAIVHSLDFSAQRADPAFAARWPDFVSALDDDSIGWGIWGAGQNFPRDPAALNGEELRQLGLAMTERWAPQMRALIGMTAPSAIHYVNVRTSVPLDPWESSTVTLLGDAVHTMTPGRGAGANTALRDAALLGDMLIEASRGERPLVDAIHAYEAEMLRYSAESVRESRKQMDAGDAIHKPVIGDVQLALMRAAMRTIDVVPSFKRRVLNNIMQVRGEN
jgi:2-polyprenyl-6-methoxyphenol hydroxylase-like FAD-dependent oxidoreductase